MPTEQPVRRSARSRLRNRVTALAATLLACLAGAAPAAPPARLQPASANGGFCTATARTQFTACHYEVQSADARGRAICINESDAADRAQCLADLAAATAEAGPLCAAQRQARLGLCDALGEDRYDPRLRPADFDDDFDHLTRPNRYVPLRAGYRWTYAGGDEVVRIEVRDRTKLINGVTCIVVNDRVEEDDVLVEDTEDWFAQKKNGDIYYCGEESKDYESFDGDDPVVPELVSIDGSFKWGREGDKGGILFLGRPRVGATYRQELSLGTAEDAATVLSIDYAFGREPVLDEHVPRAFVQRFCSAGRCVVTAEGSPLSPGELERKYYAPGIGLILEVDARSGDTIQLVGCNFDARCRGLPQP